MSDIRHLIAPEMAHLRAFARFLTRDSSQADDLVQDCLARALEHSDRFAANTNLRAWLYTIMRRVFLNDLRRDRSQTRRASDSVATANLAAPATQEHHVAWRQMERALDALSSAQREIIFLVAIEGYSYAEVAGILDIPLGTVRSRLARARDELHRTYHGVSRPSPSRDQRAVSQESSGSR